MAIGKDEEMRDEPCKKQSGDFSDNLAAVRLETDPFLSYCRSSVLQGCLGGALGGGRVVCTGFCDVEIHPSSCFIRFRLAPSGVLLFLHELNVLSKLDKDSFLLKML